MNLPISGMLSIVVMACLGTASGAASPNTDDADARASISTAVGEAASRYLKAAPQSVGLSIGVIKVGKTYTFNYGTCEKNGKTAPPSSDSLYRIASITKTFTGTLLAQAALEGKLSLDDDVRKYLAGDYPNLEFQGQPIRIVDLVNHTSGLPFNLPDIPENRPPFTVTATPDVARMIERFTRADFLDELHKVTLARVPGKSFSYSNAGAVLASIVLERIYGRSYNDLVQQKIARPLSLRDTTTTPSLSQMPRVMQGYDQSGNVTPDVSPMMLGAGGLYSTVVDMLKYAQWEMVESDAAVKLSHQPTLVIDEWFSVGLNWQMLKSNDLRRIWQEGELPGYTSTCIVFPELKIGLVVLANEDDRDSAHAFSVLADEISKALDARTGSLAISSTPAPPPKSENSSAPAASSASRAAARVPGPRNHATCVYDPSRKAILVYGGYTADHTGVHPLSDLWAWDGSGWSLVADTGLKKVVAPMVYDSKRGRVLMFGGWGESNKPDGTLRKLAGLTWKVAGDWPDLSRGDSSMVYDPVRDRVILFGGRNLDRSFGDTWEYNGSRWKIVSNMGPSERSAGAVAFDSARDVMVVYGGFMPMEGLGDTWEWDGKTWRLAADPGPGPRSWPGMAFDSKRERTILFGGEDEQGKFYSDTWAWDGKVWKLLTMVGPPARIQSVMGYDSARDRVVLFGGVTSPPKMMNDTWEFDGEKWTQR